jgi:hypothetical protein
MFGLKSADEACHDTRIGNTLPFGRGGPYDFDEARQGGLWRRPRTTHAGDVKLE